MAPPGIVHHNPMRCPHSALPQLPLMMFANSFALNNHPVNVCCPNIPSLVMVPYPTLIGLHLSAIWHLFQLNLRCRWQTCPKLYRWKMEKPAFKARSIWFQSLHSATKGKGLEECFWQNGWDVMLAGKGHAYPRLNLFIYLIFPKSLPGNHERSLPNPPLGDIGCFQSLLY